MPNDLLDAHKKPVDVGFLVKQNNYEHSTLLKLDIYLPIAR